MLIRSHQAALHQFAAQLHGGHEALPVTVQGFTLSGVEELVPRQERNQLSRRKHCIPARGPGQGKASFNPNIAYFGTPGRKSGVLGFVCCQVAEREKKCPGGRSAHRAQDFAYIL